MLYLDNSHIQRLTISWEERIERIYDACEIISKSDFSQPVKPYLRYKNPANRIIAMPAYIGGKIAFAGIKWIASFPSNLDRGLPRANAVIVLNEERTGLPVCVINSSLISGLRTASVSGVMLKEYLTRVSEKPLKVGITGYGPIGQLHAQMAYALLGDRLNEIRVFDLREIRPDLIENANGLSSKIKVVSTWEEAYQDADIFITCTVSKVPYIDLPPKKGSLQLNVSLRDYQPSVRSFMDVMVVDDWKEVCRENTDIEVMNKKGVLQEEETVSLMEMVKNKVIKNPDGEKTIMFNPMGMACFDIAIAGLYFENAKRQEVGVPL